MEGRELELARLELEVVARLELTRLGGGGGGRGTGAPFRLPLRPGGMPAPPCFELIA